MPSSVTTNRKDYPDIMEIQRNGTPITTLNKAGELTHGRDGWEHTLAVKHDDSDYQIAIWIGDSKKQRQAMAISLCTALMNQTPIFNIRNRPFMEVGRE